MKRSDSMRVAVVGAGPAGMYVVERLLNEAGLAVEIDLIERLPTPWGLVRGGVAPDQLQKKQVVERRFAPLLAAPEVRFYGNVEVGRDLRHAELADWYDAVIYATGAGQDVRLGIPGEDLPGCASARSFVGWYSGHPDCSDLEFDLSHERAVVVGNGNVALDVARMLMLPIERLCHTDIADHALAALAESRVREVLVLGRRAHFQGAFHNAQLEALAQLPGVDLVLEPEDMPPANDLVLDHADWTARRKLASLRQLAARPRHPGNRVIELRWLTSPVEVVGEERVEQLLMVRNHLEHDADGGLRARPTEEETLLDTGLILRAIGYRGYPLPGLPFDERRGVVDNVAGRVVGETGVYVCGWIKRGAGGVIGSNRKCARQTVDCLLADRRRGVLAMGRFGAREVEACLDDRTVDYVTKDDWYHIDSLERQAGLAQGRPRVKMVRRYDLLHCLADSAAG